MAKMTISGAEFKDFYDDESVWGKAQAGEVYHDDTLIKVNGEEWGSDHSYDEIPLDATVEIICGYIVDSREGRDKTTDMAKAFAAWREKRTHTVLMLKCPIHQVDALKAAAKALGCVIV